MPRYKYKAVSASGTVIEGEMEAANRQAVIDGLHQQGGTPIRADPVSDHATLHL
jgi:type II secretory pathway component PulF